MNMKTTINIDLVVSFDITNWHIEKENDTWVVDWDEVEIDNIIAIPTVQEQVSSLREKILDQCDFIIYNKIMEAEGKLEDLPDKWWEFGFESD